MSILRASVTTKYTFYSLSFEGGDSSVIYKLNLPRIASQSFIGLNRRRLGIVNAFPLLSTCSIFLCYTEQLSSLTSTTLLICSRVGYRLFKRRSSVSQFFYLRRIYSAPTGRTTSRVALAKSLPLTKGGLEGM